MRHPLRLSASGRFAEGLIELAGLSSDTDLSLPGQRPAVLETKGMVGIEADLELGPGQAWIALQLSLASRYKELVRQLIEQGALALAPGALTRPATKSASGLFEILPLAEWPSRPCAWQAAATRSTRARSLATSRRSALRFLRPPGRHWPPGPSTKGTKHETP